MTPLTHIKEFRPVDHNPFSLPEIELVVPAIQPQIEIFTSCFAGGQDASRAYNESVSLTLTGIFDQHAMLLALQGLLDRHESLRSCFSADGSQVYILKALKLDVTVKDLTDQCAIGQDKFISDFKRKEAHTTFDLQNGPLFKATLMKLADERHHLTLTSHHIVCDGWSLGILMQDLSKLYSAYASGEHPKLAKAPSFSAYALEQENFNDSAEYRRMEKYWVDQYRNSVPILDIPTDFLRPAVRTYRSHREDFPMDPEVVAAIKKVGNSAGCSFVTTVLSLFQLYLHRLTRQDDIVIGLPAAGQSVTGNYGLVSHCVNLLPLRCTINDDDSFLQYLKGQKRMVLDAYDHQLFTFSNLLQKISIPRDSSRIPLVPFIFNVDMGMDEGVAFEGLHHTYVSNPRAYETFEIFVNASGNEHNLTLEWSYNTQLFQSSTIKEMMKGFEGLTRTIVNHPDLMLRDIKIHNTYALDQAYLDWNDTYADYPRDSSLHAIIGSIALQHPEKTAIYFERKQITYRELIESSNQLAEVLLENGVQRGDTIAIALDRSHHMIVVLLAIMKTGAAYLPIDPEYPKDRVEFMLEDAAPKILLTSKKYKGTYQGNAIELVTDDIWNNLHRYPKSDPAVEVAGNDIAYLLYTSGSTGKPKGVKIAHHNLVNFLYSLRKQLSVKQSDNLLAITTLSFDISGLEMYLPLISGASVTILSTHTARDANLLLEAVKTIRPTIMQATPASWNMLLEAGWKEDAVIPTVCSGGEALSKDLAGKLMRRSKRLFNLYGPTETTIWSSVKEITAEDPVITIGFPIDNTQMYVLDDQLAMLPRNVIGEIFIAGEGVAKGYLNRPELTNEKFLDNPFSEKAGEKMYRTGDLGRILATGEIECLGRADQQIKIRGYRIEPGEIEFALTQQPDIKSAVVILREDRPGDQRLVAYVVSRASDDYSKSTTTNGKGQSKGTNEQVQKWKQGLRNALPSYMIPNDFVLLKEMPLTPNGKIDKKALPVPDAGGRDDKKYAPPTNEMEAFLVDIWKRLLRIEEIGIHDNFFELGGHSLLAMRLITAMRTKLNVEIPLIEIFESTVQTLAEKVKRLQSSDEVSQSGPGMNLTPTQASAMGKEFMEAVSEWGLHGKGNYLIPIQKDGTKIPFIGIISFYSYHLLAKYMPGDQPLYYLPPTRSASVETIAEHYVKEIKQLQPNGPYCIGGFCDGGNVAFEIAHQLEAQGDEVSALILFEYYSPTAVISKKSTKYIKRRLGYYGTRLKALTRQTSNPLKLLKLIVKNSYERFKDSFMEPPPPKFLTSNEYYKYKFKPYSGKVILFQAGSPPLEIDESPLMGWSDYFVGDVKVITVDAGHLGIFREPAIGDTGVKLGKALADLNQDLSTEEVPVQKPEVRKEVPVKSPW